jgi:hypothetical protein
VTDKEWRERDRERERVGERREVQDWKNKRRSGKGHKEK